MFIVQSEYDGDIFVAANAISPLEAIETAREQGMLGVLNAVQVQDQDQALYRVRAAVEFVRERFGPSMVFYCLPNSEMRKLSNGDIVLDFNVGIWTFTYYPYTGAGGGGPWRVCNT